MVRNVYLVSNVLLHIFLVSAMPLAKADYDETKKMLKVENDADKPGMLVLKSLANGSLGFRWSSAMPLLAREAGIDGGILW